MNYATVCSGIEALSVAVDGMGWNAKWFSEIEPFPCRVLKHHYPHVPNLGDMLKIENNETFQKESIDLLCGGTPCQSFSVAGLRGGLADVRGNLALEFCRILVKKQPRWFWWENVPGVLSSNGGGDLAAIITAFSECGYSCAWRVLDAQFFGVAQRRRRIFVVGYLGNDWRPPVAVLFERESLFRNIKTGKETREDIAGTVDASTGRSRGAGINPGLTIPYNVSFNDVNGQRKDRPNGGLYINETETHSALTRALATDTLLVGSWWDGSQTAQILDAVLYKGQTMPEKNRFPAIIFHDKASAAQSMNPSNISPSIDTVKVPSILYEPASAMEENWKESDIKNALRADASKSSHAVVSGLKVRRITPMEAERLQGFPDQYTGIKGAKDSPRYKAIGNSMAVVVMKWIATRMQIVNQIFHKDEYPTI